MNKCILIVAVAVLSLLSACATRIPVSGKTVAGDLLKADTTRDLVMRAKLEGNCDQISSIETQILFVSPRGTGRTPAERMYGGVNERWVVNLCGKSIRYLVTFTPDGDGGTFYLISREPSSQDF